MDYAFAPGATRPFLRARQLLQRRTGATPIHKPKVKRVAAFFHGNLEIHFAPARAASQRER